MTDWLTGGPAREDMAETVGDIAQSLLGEGTMSRAQVSEEAGLELTVARRFWQALGFANVQADDVVFAEADAEALRTMAGLVERGVLDQEGAVAMTRALGRTAERLAIWQAEMVGEAVRVRREVASPAGDHHALRPGEPVAPLHLDAEGAREAASELSAMADSLEPLLVYAWRRHVAGALARLIADAEPLEEHGDGVHRTVGFVDMVSFTAFVQQASDVEISRLVQRFEAISSDVVAAHGGRVIKTIGDEVLYQAFDAVTAAQIAIDVVAAAAADPLLPPLRAGIASGRVLPRLGDVYGTTVNRAARLIRQAAAGTVLLDEETAADLGEAGGWRMSRLAPRMLHGLGQVTPWQLLAGPPPGTPGAAQTTYAPATGPIPVLPDLATPAPVPFAGGSSRSTEPPATAEVGADRGIAPAATPGGALGTVPVTAIHDLRGPAA